MAIYVRVSFKPGEKKCQGTNHMVLQTVCGHCSLSLEAPLTFLSLFSLTLSPQCPFIKISEYNLHELSSGILCDAQYSRSMPRGVVCEGELRDMSCFQMSPHTCCWPQLGAPCRHSWAVDLKLSLHWNKIESMTSLENREPGTANSKSAAWCRPKAGFGFERCSQSCVLWACHPHSWFPQPRFCKKGGHILTFTVKLDVFSGRLRCPGGNVGRQVLPHWLTQEGSSVCMGTRVTTDPCTSDLGEHLTSSCL